MAFGSNFCGAGVGTGLRAFPLPTMPATPAYEVINFAFAKKLGVSDSAIDEWRSDISSHMRESLPAWLFHQL